MNRRSFLGLLPVAPFAAPAIAKEAAADITQSLVRSRAIARVDRMFGAARTRVMQPQIARMGISVDSSELDRAVAALRSIPVATRVALRDHMSDAAEREVDAFAKMLEPLPDGVWPI